ncbi:MAG: redoxin domain-containing protein [Phycisphaeraceae bacterium]|nr:redoxin domain-containing protein [Phycisphaeraceae bacterium]
MQISPPIFRLFFATVLTCMILTGCDATPAIQRNHQSPLVQQGQTLAPDFKLQNHQGEMVQLSALRGRWILLYFYPLSDTPSCACQANEFTGLIRNLAQVNAMPLAISVDMPDMVDVYRSKYQLPFTLLGDEDARVTQMYRAWKGNLQNGITQRTAILVNPQGKIVHKQVINTAQKVIQALQSVRNQYP